jgi:hypothetical protein
MFFELDSLIQPTDLSHLDAPFSIAEIDAIVKDMPIDKTPGLMVSMACSSRSVGPSSRRIFMVCSQNSLIASLASKVLIVLISPWFPRPVAPHLLMIIDPFLCLGNQSN